MIDPILSLAISVHSNRGVYALLLGSGVSRSSGVPTGWDVVQDLIRKLAALKGAGVPADPEAWYRTVFGREPDYSEILDEIAKSPSERMQLLRGYFEPSEQEREEGRKLPTAAHRSIAELISKGYIRVVVTTNFDRLLEQALVDLGIQPMVVSSGDSARGALPLAHSRCTVIKVNGDYLDARLKNTAEELASYESKMERLLDQVFDEYGLIVCGWSGDWDIALRGAIERCPNRRFTTYWSPHGKLGEAAQKLVNHRGATVLGASSADELFKDLLDKVTALEQLGLTDPVPTKVAVARMKRYLVDDAHRISLADVLVAETERAHTAIADGRFTVQTDPQVKLTKAVVAARLQAYEGAVDTLLNLVICGGYWAQPNQDELLCRSLRRVALDRGQQSGLTIWIHLRRYPALLLMYGTGLAAVCHGNYRLLRRLLHLRVSKDGYHPEEPFVNFLHNRAAMPRDSQAVYLENPAGISNRMFNVLRDPLREHLPDDKDYERTFAWFEYLLCLVHCDLNITRTELQRMKAQDPNFVLKAPVGRFAWGAGWEDIAAETELLDAQPLPAKVDAVLRAGFFESTGQPEMIDKYRDVKAGFDRFLASGTSQWIPLGR